MKWLARQAQNWVWESDNIGGTFWIKNCNHIPKRADDLLLPNGRRLQGWVMGVASNYGDIGCLVVHSAGLWNPDKGATAFFEFGVMTSSQWAFNFYDPRSNWSHNVIVYANPETKQLNSFQSFDGAAVHSYGIFESGRAAGGQPIYTAWIQVTSGYGVNSGYQRNLYIYPNQLAVASLSAASYGIFIGHVQIMDGLVDPRSVPWFITSGAPLNLNSYDGSISLDAVALPVQDGEFEHLDSTRESRHETVNGAQYRYRWGSREARKVSLSFADSLTANRINSYWQADTKLLLVDDEVLQTTSVQITNEDQPMSMLVEGLYDRWQGVIDLEGY